MRRVAKIDIGRLVSVPIFAWCIILIACSAYKDIEALSPFSAVKAAGLIHHILLVCFYALLILLYFLRTPATLTHRSLLTNTIAVMATFAPFVLPFLNRPGLTGPATIIIADVIITIGMVFSIYSLSVLGRSFSIIPQARRLVQSGPYRLVRHPMYLAELIGLLGVVFAGFTISKLVLYLFLVTCQIYRAFQEEKLLATVFPEYEEYCSRTARFIPRLF